jgi:membrane protein YdbS with pleckstrin-like domain
MSHYSDHLEVEITPSQWTNFAWFIAGAGLIMFVVPPIFAFGKYLEVLFWKYQFRERTIIERKGIFSVTRTEVHYYRIKSIVIEEPFWMRFFNLGNITIISSDPYQNVLRLWAVPQPLVLKEAIRERVHHMRKKENIREFDNFHL